MFKISSIILAAVMMLGASAQAQTQVPADSGNPTPTFRIAVVSRTTRAVSYNRDAAASSDAQLQQALRERGELRARLLQQFNLILETRDTARGLVVNMSDVLFDSGKFTLRPLAREKLAKISGIVLAYPTLNFAIEGNTDSVGSESFNQDLSEKRAEGVRSYLTQQGVPASSTTATGFGKARPIASNDTSEGRQLNRRVELIVSGEVISTKIVSLSLQPVVAVTSPQ